MSSSGRALPIAILDLDMYNNMNHKYESGTSKAAFPTPPTIERQSLNKKWDNYFFLY
jgi:hypothetical protein